MSQLQPYVSNVPLQVAKNLRFNDANNIPVTQMLPVGMNGTFVNDSPTTGYISRIGAVLSDQIDLYNQVNATLQQYAQDISELDQRVTNLETSGNTIPNVNGFCFTGDAQSPITTVVELIAESTCDYNTVLGTTSALMEAIVAEGANVLNSMPAFSIPAGVMQALSGWKPNPQTIADTINNLWLAYLDQRIGTSTALAEMTPSCSQAIVNFDARFIVAPGSGSGFFVYFSGYSFIPTAYSDNGSTITIKDNIGGVYTVGVDLVARSQPGADPLFVGISGTALAVVPSYSVILESKLKSSSNTCTKTVIHSTTESACGDCSGSTQPVYEVGTLRIQSPNPAGDDIPTNLVKATYADVIALDAQTKAALILGYYFDFSGSVPKVFFDQNAQNLNLKWIAYV